MKRRIFEADLSRKEKKVLTELELEAQDRAQCLVERANALRMEQDEEIRLLDTVGSSCRHVDDLRVHHSIITSRRFLIFFLQMCVSVCVPLS